MGSIPFGKLVVDNLHLPIPEHHAVRTIGPVRGQDIPLIHILRPGAEPPPRQHRSHRGRKHGKGLRRLLGIQQALLAGTLNARGKVLGSIDTLHYLVQHYSTQPAGSVEELR